uniref:Non-structural maintenance of chromosomes element 1 homolog n=1 Tax=Panagrolaimus davidi TaxID=227884 RepID=A0A914QLY9_9BILA
MKSLLHVAEKHGNPHKVLLQLICQNGGIRLSKIVEVFQAICDAALTPTSIPEQCTIKTLSKALIKSINAVIEPMELKVAIATDYRFPDEQFLTLYSTSSGGKFTKIFTPDELELFQKWFNLMFVDATHRGELHGVEAINVQFDGRKRPILAEAFLKKLVEDNILVKLQKYNSFIFSSKSVLELEPRLRANNYDIPQCPVCSLLIIVQRFSYTCETCESSIHNTCLFKYVFVLNLSYICKVNIL